MYELSSDAKKRAKSAISWVEPNRFKGIMDGKFALIRSNIPEGIDLSISVQMNPGAMQLTLIPLGANSFAAVRVIPMIPAFVAE